ncbi:hypothetical protein F4808DRAFT_437096 [Astrocystis sublimbata]|nr:hypothetical protein F4808DRAFT_437096 [Astrocystis sublimbata]
MPQTAALPRRRPRCRCSVTLQIYSSGCGSPLFISTLQAARAEEGTDVTPRQFPRPSYRDPQSHLPSSTYLDNQDTYSNRQCLAMLFDRRMMQVGTRHEPPSSTRKGALHTGRVRSSRRGDIVKGQVDQDKYAGAEGHTAGYRKTCCFTPPLSPHGPGATRTT